MNNDILERKAINILKKGWMPTSNKNLLTFTALGVLMFVFGQAAHTLGYTQAQADCKHQQGMINAQLTSPPRVSSINY